MDKLFCGAHGNASVEALWTYMPYGPFGNSGAIRRWLQDCASSSDPLFFTAHGVRCGRRVGMVSFLHFVGAMRSTEPGHIWN